VIQTALGVTKPLITVRKEITIESLFFPRDEKLLYLRNLFHLQLYSNKNFIVKILLDFSEKEWVIPSKSFYS